MSVVWKPLTFLVSDDTLRRVRFDLRRTRVRLKRRGERDVTPPSRKLHLGSGGRKITGWLNVDVRRSDYDVDLASGRLPWRSDSFDLVVGQHFIEHLDLHTELLPLLAELNRVIRPDGEIWLSCPDIEKICRSYVDHRMVDLIEDRQRRWPGTYALGEVPSSQMINDLFHQFGQHKNLFDFDLLAWALRSTGFANVRRVDEADLLARAGEFPERGDDRQSLYVTASVP
jgi:predicted SAM-dependent methyltransferase